MAIESVRCRLSTLRASFRRRLVALAHSGSDPLPPRDPLPRYLAPVPKLLEDVGLRLAWPIVAVNLAGTAFGFWYYRGQFGDEPVVMWPFVPDSPLATLLFALAVASWKLGRERPWLTALAFFGCVKTGLWTPFVLVVFADGFSYVHPAMYHFLFWSHLAMVVQALVLHRITDFPVWGVSVALAWFTVDVIVDYFVPIVGDLHHTSIPVERDAPMWLGATAIDLAAAAAVLLVLLATMWSLAIRVKTLEARAQSS